MSTRCNIIIKKGEDKVLLYRHCDGYPSATGRDLLKLCSECKFDVFKLFKYLANSGAYELSSFKHGDAEYEYVIDLDSKRIYADNLNTKESFDQDDF